VVGLWALANVGGVVTLVALHEPLRFACVRACVGGWIVCRVDEGSQVWIEGGMGHGSWIETTEGVCGSPGAKH